MEIKTSDLVSKIDEKLSSMRKAYDSREIPKPGMVYKTTDWDRVGKFLTGENCVNAYTLINEKQSNLSARARNYVMVLTTQCIFELLNVHTIQHTTNTDTNS
jgi:hypothetical protein